MRTHLKLDALPLATTNDGKRFTLKSLNPADHEIKAVRLPGGNRPTVALQVDYVVDWASGGRPCAIVMVPHAACPMTLVENFGLEGQTAYHLYNPALGGTWSPARNLYNVTTFVTGLFERYRINAQCLTAELVAPKLADQGTVTSAQFTLAAQKFPLLVTKGETPDGATYTTMGVAHMMQPPPAGSDILLGTTAYTAPAREGVYVPLRLTNFKWRDTNTLHSFIESASPVPTVPLSVNTGAVTGATGFPFYLPAKPDGTWNEVMTVPMSGSVASITYFRGLADTASIRIRFRQVIEGIAYPATSYAPMAVMPPEPDELAVRMYLEISQRMADGYPASFNDSGRLGQIVRNIGSKIIKFVDPALDVLSAVPGPVGTVASGAKMVKTALGTGTTVSKSVADQVIAEIIRRYPRLPVVCK